MDEFDIYTQTAGSKDFHKNKTVTVFPKPLEHPSQLKGDWNDGVDGFILPTSTKLITTTKFPN